MRHIFLFFSLIFFSSPSWAIVFDCTLNFKFGNHEHTQKLVVQYEGRYEYLQMPVVEVLENNIPKLRSMGIELVGTGLAKINGKEERLFIQSYWSTENDLRALLADPFDRTSIIAFNIKYGNGKPNEKLPIHLYYSKPVGDAFRTGICLKL